jgi:hypothetical protein
VALVSIGEAKQRQQDEVVDCRGWGRYVGRIYRGKNKKMVVVVQAYFPDAEFDPDDAGCQNYSQLLGWRASKVIEGTPAGRWRLRMPPPKPTADEVRHPKRLLMADLETHLMLYALNPNCTIILMGDANVDIHSRPGTDTDSYRTMMTKLGSMSCGEAR